MPQGRKIPEAKFERVKKLVEEGEIGFEQIGKRLGLSSGSVSLLAKKHGWKNPRKERFSYPGNL